MAPENLIIQPTASSNLNTPFFVKIYPPCEALEAGGGGDQRVRPAGATGAQGGTARGRSASLSLFAHSHRTDLSQSWVTLMWVRLTWVPRALRGGHVGHGDVPQDRPVRRVWAGPG
jgi:hypothetical protein